MERFGGKKRKYLLLSGAILGSVLILAGLWYVLFRVNRFELEISLLGKRDVQVEYGDAYREPGAKLLLRGTLLMKDGMEVPFGSIVTEGTVRQDVLGENNLHYQGQFLWWSAEAHRTVTVADTQPPQLTLNPDPEGSLLPGRIYKEAGFRAYDNYDGDITDRVVRTESLGCITYTVTDSSGNTAFQERIVPAHDPIPPEIILEGEAHMKLLLGREYQEPGFTAVDNYDGDLTELVAVEGTVDRFTTGIYPILYIVADDYGNVTVMQRDVEVCAAERPETQWPMNKTIYLTFDDGPGPYTRRLLDILDAYGVKATFFVMDTGYDDVMADIVARGHSIGIHSVTHTYEEIYASREAFFQDLLSMQQIIYENTGVMTTLMRFPGGSSNTVSCDIQAGIMTELEQLVQDAGFQFFDWNVDSDDAGRARLSRHVFQNVVTGVMDQGIAVVLQHDIQGFSVEAVEDIIIWGLNNGYRFLPLSPDSPGFHHGVQN